MESETPSAAQNGSNPIQKRDAIPPNDPQNGDIQSEKRGAGSPDTAERPAKRLKSAGDDPVPGSDPREKVPGMAMIKKESASLVHNPHVLWH